MAYYLTIDQGNTCIKVDIWNGDDDTIVASKTLDTLPPSTITDICRTYQPAAAIYCTVGNRDASIVESLKAHTPHAIELTVKTPMPIRIAYDTPDTLGVDRVAAAIGAYSICGSHNDILVIDIGTAITYDIVSATGIYRGGNIAPGLDMRLNALHHFTARLPLVTADEHTQVPTWGTDTTTALQAGAIGGIVGEILYYRQCAGPAAQTVITGGQASLILSRLSFEPITHTHLVSLGLYSILRYNYQ